MKSFKSFYEDMTFKVEIEGLPALFMAGNSPGQVKNHLRKLIKQPSMIKGVERQTKHDVKKMYRKKAQGKEIDEGLNELSPDTIKSYKKKASNSNYKAASRFARVAGSPTSRKYKNKEMDRLDNIGRKRKAGLAMADKKEDYENVKEAIKYTHVAVDKKGKVAGMASKASDAKDMARRHGGTHHQLKKPMHPKVGDMMINKSFNPVLKKEAMSTSSGPFGINPTGIGVKVMKKGKEVKPTPPKIGVVSYTGGKKDKPNEGYPVLTKEMTQQSKTHSNLKVAVGKSAQSAKDSKARADKRRAQKAGTPLAADTSGNVDYGSDKSVKIMKKKTPCETNEKLTIGKIRRAAYKTGKVLGDVNAVKRGKVAKRVKNRLVGKLLGKAVGKMGLFK